MSDQSSTPIATQNIGSAPLEDDNIEQEEEKGWARLTSISQNLNTLTPVLEIPSSIIITGDRYLIGRQDSNDLVLSHLGVSGTHLEIQRSIRSDQVAILIDRSTNGTYVNSERIQRGVPKEVDFGARIEILRIDRARVGFVIGSSQSTAALLNNKYLLRRALGTGAYAEVKLAVDPQSGYQYAIKIIERSKLGLGTAAQEQLLSEVSILKGLNHYGVVRVHDYFGNENRFFIVLDYMPAGDLLDHLLARKQAFDEDSARDIFCQLVEAVHYLHQNNVAHRDIKPENILLDDREWAEEENRKSKDQEQNKNNSNDNSNNNNSNIDPKVSQSQNSQPPPIELDNVTSSQAFKLHRESTKERYFISSQLKHEYASQPPLGQSKLRIKLTDFGLSKSTEDNQRLKTICGTPQYLAPEVLKHFNPGSNSHAEDRTYGKEVDVWSIGAILFVILTMHTPFPEQNLMQRALAGTYDRHRLAALSEDVQHIIERMLCVDVKQRITTDEIFQHPWCKDLFIQRKNQLDERLKAVAIADKLKQERRAAAAAAKAAQENGTTTTTTTTPSTTSTTNPSTPSTVDVQPAGPTKRKQLSGQQEQQQQQQQQDDDDDDSFHLDSNEDEDSNANSEQPQKRSRNRIDQQNLEAIQQDE